MNLNNTLVNEIIEALREIGGTGTLTDIYNRIEKRGNISLVNYKDWKSLIRKHIYLYSSDTDIFKGIPGDENDIFYSTGGKGTGVWGLRKMENVNQDTVSIKAGITRILNEYLNEKTKPFSQNQLGYFVRHTITNEIKKLNFIDNKYKVAGSVGNGNWAGVPWIAILNKSITNSTQRGYYLVYLFCEDMNNVYLTFAQGVTETSKEEMEQIKGEIRDILPINSKFKTEPKIQLGEGKLARQYEESVAAYIEYSKAMMPSNQELIDDLKLMIELYEKFVIFKNSQPINLNVLNQNEVQDVTSTHFIEQINGYISGNGFFYKKENIINLYLSIRSKPFVIISGISGTGKTKIVQLFAESIGATEENGQFKLIPVRPDWSDSSELLGYTDIKGEFNRGPLTEMVEQALQNPKLPYFVLLDEMNLARVEYYFSDILSVMESRKKEEGQITSSTLITIEGRSLTLPGNLYIIGTVNMDETTHPFSKKVLDRANTIEFNEIDLMNFGSMYTQEPVEPIRVSNDILESSYIHLIDAFPNNEGLIKEVSQELEAINDILKPIHAQIGYRVRDEICFYMIHNDEAGLLLSREDAMDFCIMQKILPRIGGTEGVVRPVLEKLKEVLPANKYPRCSEKIAEMIRRADSDGFTSFWVS